MSEADVPAYEPRPRDFAARMARRAPALAARAGRRHRGRRLVALLAAAAFPAMAAPAGWQALAVGDAGQSKLDVEAMPFEQPGESFPGSAFYYLAVDDRPYLALAPGSHFDSDDHTGPIAQALRIDMSGVDRSRALECLTAAVYYEAASEPDQGQRGVAQVVLNRVAHPSFPNTVCGVVYQGSERSTGCQFSFSCDGALARRPDRFFWERAQNVARAAMAGYVERSVGLATFYHTIAVHPYWDAKVIDLGTIGAHRFFRFPGAAGEQGAFRFAYGGGEPVAAPHPRSAATDRIGEAALDPLALERAYDAGLRTAQQDAGTRRASAPVYAAEVQARGGDALYSGERLPQATGVRPEYANSGKWIGKPAS